MRALRRAAVALASVLAATALIFAGYSSWTFSTQRRTDINADVFITQAALCGSFTNFVAPSYVVLDEGALGNATTITGVSFYKAPRDGDTLGGISLGNESIVVDPDLSISFLTNAAMTQEEVSALKFGMRVSVTGTLSEYVHTTGYYESVDRQEAAPSTGNADFYIDLKALAEIPDFDGNSRYKEKQQSDGRWLLTFGFTTTTLNSFFTFMTEKRPTGDKSHYDAIVEYIKRNKDTVGEFVLDLWQGY